MISTITPEPVVTPEVPQPTVEPRRKKRTIKSRVAAGALLLDERNPGWHWDVNLDLLDLGDGHQCVLGQLYGFYTDGRNALYGNPNEPVTGPFRPANHDAARHGFFSFKGFSSKRYSSAWLDGYNGENGGSYGYMTTLWSQEITRRRNRDVAEGRR